MVAGKQEMGIGSYCAVVPYDERYNVFPTRNRRDIPKGACRIVVALFPYKTRAGGDAVTPNISQYAGICDYHTVILRRLSAYAADLSKEYEGYDFAVFCDNSPIDEVLAAESAGLGFRGRNSLLITKEYGSFVFIGTIVTNAPLLPTNVLRGISLTEGTYACNNCGACVRACIGGALTGCAFDKTKCLSYVTQKKGALTENEERLIKSGGSAWGCDICQNVCPLNKEAGFTDIEEFKNSAFSVIDEDTAERLYKSSAFAYKNIDVIKRNLKLLQRRDRRI